MKNLKIIDSKGNLYLICPFIERIKFLLNGYYIPDEDLVDINRQLEAISAIASVHQNECPDASIEDAKHKIVTPYNFQAAIGRMKALFPDQKDKIDEIIRIYL